MSKEINKPIITIAVKSLDVMGGTHKQILRLAEYLQANKVEFEIVTTTYDRDKTYPEFQKFNIKHLNERQSKSKTLLGNHIESLIDQYKLFKKVDKKSKLINVHDNGLLFFHVLSKMFGRKIFWQINDMPWTFNLGNSRKIGNIKTIRKIYTAIANKIYKSISKFGTDLITVNVTKNKERVRQELGRDALVLYCGVDKWRGKKIRRFGIDGKINILSSGVFFGFRNYETQIKIVKILKERGFDVQLNIIGSTDLDVAYANKIRMLIKQASLENEVHIKGQVGQAEYHQLHEESDIFMFINIDQSWGLAVFEAMSAGLPVLVSNSVGATELLTDEENALFVDPINEQQIIEKILSLLNKDFYQKISIGGMSLTEKLTWDGMYSRKIAELMINEY